MGKPLPRTGMKSEDLNNVNRLRDSSNGNFSAGLVVKAGKVVRVAPSTSQPPVVIGSVGGGSGLVLSGDVPSAVDFSATDGSSGNSDSASPSDHSHAVTGVLLPANGGAGASNTGASGKVLVGQGTTFTEQAVSGDATISALGVVTLSTSGVSAGTYGDANNVPVLTVDAKGRTTVASTTAISGGGVPFPAWSSVVTYSSGQVVAGSDGNLYRSVVGSNTNHDPTGDDGTHFEAFRIYSNLTVTCGTTGGTSIAVTGATNASPIVLTVTAHKFKVGDVVVVSGVLGNTAANGTWTISAIATNTITLSGSTGNGTWSAGGTQTAKVTGRFTDSGSGIRTALNFIKNAIWDVANVTVTVDVKGGAYTESSAITVNHICGSGLSITADATTPANVQITFSGTTDAITTTVGNTLGNLNGIKLVGASAANFGLHAQYSSRIKCGTAIVITGFATGISADQFSFIYCRSAIVTSCTTGLIASTFSFIDARTSTVNTNTTGYKAQVGGYIVVTSNAVSGNSTDYNPTINTTGNANAFIENTI